jgi:hypothetical protein
MVNLAAYHRKVKALGIRGPISIHFEYPPLEGKNDLPEEARRRQAVALMKRDLDTLRRSRAEAGL